ncbi:MAG: beta-ketoacyl-ACP synthase III [Candidatus Zixiibacteriota bacterium]
MPNAKIKGIGACVPDKILTNADLEKIVDTSDEWITTRSGIKERHIVTEDQASSDLSTIAAKNALEDAGIEAEELDLIIIGTVTPDYMFPSTASIVQKNLGIKNIPCFDFEAACAGFLYGVHTARAFIESGLYKNVLVIGVELLTKITNWEDRSTCVLFGDGAGAAIVSVSDEGDQSKILSSAISADGHLGHLLLQPAGGSRNPPSHETVEKNLHTIQMAGREVFKHAVSKMAKISKEAMKMAGLKPEDIDWVVPHQANIRIIDSLTKKLKQPSERVIKTIHKYGNTSSSSVPIAMVDAYQEGKFKRGDKILLVAFGGGFTWGSVLLNW